MLLSVGIKTHRPVADSLSSEKQCTFGSNAQTMNASSRAWWSGGVQVRKKSSSSFQCFAGGLLRKRYRQFVVCVCAKHSKCVEPVTACKMLCRGFQCLYCTPMNICPASLWGDFLRLREGSVIGTRYHRSAKSLASYGFVAVKLLGELKNLVRCRCHKN